jgi:hypothetical protein
MLSRVARYRLFAWMKSLGVRGSQSATSTRTLDPAIIATHQEGLQHEQTR